MFEIVVLESEVYELHMLMSEVANVRFGDAACSYTDEEKLIELIKDADGVVITSRGKFTRKVISAAKRLKIIAKCGAIPNNVDIAAATEYGVAVTWTPGSNPTSVAEHALTMMMSLLKLVPQTMRGLQQGKWHTAEQKASELSGKTIGIVGLGQAGYCLAELLKGFGTKLLCYDPYVNAERLALTGARSVDLDTLLTCSDVVTLHCKMCDETYHLIDKNKLQKMKKNAFLVNTARGALVDESALLEALSNNWIAGAGLDVFEVEPASKDNPLFSLDNVLVTPHMAGCTKEAHERESRGSSEEVIRILKGQTPVHLANPEYVKFVAQQNFADK